MNALVLVVLALLVATLLFVVPPLLKGDPDGTPDRRGTTPRP